MPKSGRPKPACRDLPGRASKASLPGFEPRRWVIDYDAIASVGVWPDLTQRAQSLAQRLPVRWWEIYVAVSVRPTNVLRLEYRGFTYLFDWYSRYFTAEQMAADRANEDRLVAAFGFSGSPAAKRNTSRQRGWIGPTEENFGSDRDKGHFVSHALGGGLEINLFVQVRALNRGWSAAGRRYRAMENYCLQRPGTFFFNRPLYADGTAQPAVLELGILKADGELWVEQFEN